MNMNHHWMKPCGNATCIEIAWADDDRREILIRATSKDPNTWISCTTEEWRAFLAGLRGDAFEGAFDDEAAA